MGCANILGSILLFSVGNFSPCSLYQELIQDPGRKALQKGSQISYECQRRSITQKIPDKSQKRTEYHLHHVTVCLEGLSKLLL